ncbi:MAG: Gfo/Idh/MocA family protein, partial [Myxococcota bacterium]
FLARAGSGAIDPSALDAQTVDFAEAEAAYEALAKGERRGLAVVFRYDTASSGERSLALEPAGRAARKARSEVGLAFVGAGNYAKAILLPAVSRCKDVKKLHVVTATGASARKTAEKFGYAACGTDAADVFGDADVDLVFVATQHDSHAALGCRALRAGKAVWLEKPAALHAEELAELMEAARETGGFLTVGYNRRFSPHARAIRAAFERRSGAMAIRYTVAAGATPSGTWHLDPAVGGGRIVGEGCHFVDLCTYLVGGLPTSVYARALGRDPETDDSTVLMLGWDDGSTATIEYLARASSALPKERFEVSAQGRTATCDNYRETKILGGGGKGLKTVNQDKGQATAVAEVVAAVRSGSSSPFTLEELRSTTLVTFAAARSIESGQAVAISGAGE